MKSVKQILLTFSALAILATSLTSCTTLANRRDLYAPDTAKGPYTDLFRKVEGIGPTTRLGHPDHRP